MNLHENRYAIVDWINMDQDWAICGNLDELRN